MIRSLRMLYRGENSWSFQEASKKVLLFSAVAVVVCVGALLIRGLNLGVEFNGGSVWEVPAPAPAEAPTSTPAEAPTPAPESEVTVELLSEVAQQSGVPDARVQLVTITGGNDIFRVRGALAPLATAAGVAEALAAAAGVDPESLSTRQVSPSFGNEVAGKARVALVVFLLLIALYLWVRFEWKMSVGALVALIHDVVLTVGAYALFGFEVTPATVVAFLTIMGYSLYDTIVVFDRVKTNERRLPDRSHVTYTSLADVSLNQVLMRSINTSITSALPVMALLVIGAGFLGAGALQEFAVALLIGILVGSYSSLFVAMPTVTALKVREAAWAGAQQAAEALGSHASIDVASSALAAQRYTRTATPRPRKRGKRR